MPTYKVVVTKDYTRWCKPDTNILHREEGPAVEIADGYKAWYLNGKRHREDGPAVEYANGDKEWYLNGKSLTEAKWREAIQPQPSCEGIERDEAREKWNRAIAEEEDMHNIAPGGSVIPRERRLIEETVTLRAENARLRELLRRWLESPGGLTEQDQRQQKRLDADTLAALDGGDE